LSSGCYRRRKRRSNGLVVLDCRCCWRSNHRFVILNWRCRRRRRRRGNGLVVLGCNHRLVILDYWRGSSRRRSDRLFLVWLGIL
jgi:hypothetical protein